MKWQFRAAWHAVTKQGSWGWLFLPAGFRNSVGCVLVDFWPEIGTISTAFIADVLYRLPCPFSEEVPVKTDLPVCTTSQPHLIAVNVHIIFFYLYQCCIIMYFSVCKYLSWNCCFYCTLIFLCCALTLTMVKCWAVNRLQLCVLQ